ncbi:hypothetical protein EJ06DRAFT_426768 [Trichodelitschia bisporula]|uniref:Zn(2)-C6 fungal-type domain-containing protein n=1 Tax=Trichodelitschia bisporula TaxID=703511 RepID=A0A6G1HWU3_9PEZI|nr:hypothetical protein EJ06DRAFT_426768 [Trichodelitschia bisporula]
MSQPPPDPPQRGLAKRAKRAARACDHCRWKRLKCSDEAQNESCMNCIMYGTKCEYTSSWPSQAGKGKYGGDRSASGVAKARRKAKTASRERLGSDPTVASSSKDAATVGSRDSLSMTTSPVDERLGGAFGDLSKIGPMDEEGSERSPADSALSICPEPENNSLLARDQLGKKLAHYLTPLMTGLADNHEDVVLSAEETGLPPQPLAEALVHAFFENVVPIYPVVEESVFRAEVTQYYQGQRMVDQLWLNMVRLVMCAGAAACNDNIGVGQDIDLKAVRETLFGQVLSTIYVVYSRPRFEGIQVLLLIALYSTQIKRPNSAWLWCRWAIRLSRGFSVRERTGYLPEPRDGALKDRVLWTLFIVESQLSLMQFRDDPRLLEARIKEPDDGTKKKYPIFCHRITLARLVNRFCRVGVDGAPDPVEFTKAIEQLHQDIAGWKDAVPLGFQPGNDIFAEPQEYQAVLLMHIEYHALLVAMFISLGAASRLLPSINVDRHPSIRLRSHTSICVGNARRLLHTLNSIADTEHLRPSVSCWINAMRILGAFALLYTHVMQNPTLLSARSDLELLSGAPNHFRRHMAETPRNKNVAALVVTMYNNAASAVTQPRIHPSPLNPTNPLSAPQPAQTSSYHPPSFQGFMPAQTPGGVPAETFDEGASPGVPLMPGHAMQPGGDMYYFGGAGEYRGPGMGMPEEGGQVPQGEGMGDMFGLPDDLNLAAVAEQWDGIFWRGGLDGPI